MIENIWLKKNTETTETPKSSVSKDWVENANLHKPILIEWYVKYNFLAPLTCLMYSSKSV